MIVEYRAWITIPDLPYTGRAGDHERLHRVLDRDYGNYGPVMTWTGPGWGATQVVVSVDALDPAMAAGELAEVVAAALRESGLADRYPSAIGVAAADDPIGVPA